MPLCLGLFDAGVNTRFPRSTGWPWHACTAWSRYSMDSGSWLTHAVDSFRFTVPQPHFQSPSLGHSVGKRTPLFLGLFDAGVNTRFPQPARVPWHAAGRFISLAFVNAARLAVNLTTPWQRIVSTAGWARANPSQRRQYAVVWLLMLSRSETVAVETNNACDIPCNRAKRSTCCNIVQEKM